MRKPPQKLNPRWTQACRPEEIEEVEKRLLQNADLFLLLDKILVDKLRKNTRERHSRSSYELPSWSEFQADCNAYERALEEVRTYLKITKEN
jgi:hypothetical protein